MICSCISLHLSLTDAQCELLSQVSSALAGLTVPRAFTRMTKMMQSAQSAICTCISVGWNATAAQGGASACSMQTTCVNATQADGASSTDTHCRIWTAYCSVSLPTFHRKVRDTWVSLMWLSGLWLPTLSLSAASTDLVNACKLSCSVGITVAPLQRSVRMKSHLHCNACSTHQSDAGHNYDHQ